MCVIDYNKVFYCVDHVNLWNVAREMGARQHLIDLTKNLCTGQGAKILDKGEY